MPPNKITAQILKRTPSLQLSRETASDFKKTFEKISDFSWCTPDKNRRMVEEELETYVEEMVQKVRDLLKEIDILKFIKIPRIFQEISKEIFMKMRALNTLRETFEVLQHINFF